MRRGMAQALHSRDVSRHAVLVVVALVSAVAAMLIPATAGARPQLDDGRAGPGERWDPGKLLVRFRDGTSARERTRIVRAAGDRVVTRVPLVPNLFEVAAPAGARVLREVRELDARRAVLYAQPDWVTRDKPEAAPTEAGYWPNDPLFWPSRSTNPNRCSNGSGGADSQRIVGQWNLWRLGTNLSDSAWGRFHRFNPLPAAQRADRSGGRDVWSTYDSINVMPVWNLLKSKEAGDGGLGDPRRHPFTSFDIERSGVAIQDTGLSDHEDIRDQVAAEFSTVKSNEKEIENGAEVEINRERVRQIYRDNPARNDIAAVRQLILQRGRADYQVQDNNRPLFALDDAGVLDPNVWKPSDPQSGALLLPKGCDGHGTFVGSQISASGNNGKGIVGVGYDAPLIGLRTGMPWDRPGTTFARNDRLIQARDAWDKDWTARLTTESKIAAWSIVEALQIPVLNMSHGDGMFIKKNDAAGNEHPVVKDPALVEALGKLLSKGTTLAVVSGGNLNELYGSGNPPQGARLYSEPNKNNGVKFPCGLRMVPKVSAWVDAGDTATEPFSASRQIDWDRVNMLCVAATTSNGSQLSGFSGSGPANHDIAAPGQTVLGAERPAVTVNGNVTTTTSAYATGDGTSYAAPAVAGAASLLRQAAPGAPISVIAESLRRGSRVNPALIGKVTHGQLDVACSLSWLRAAQRRRNADWGVINPAGDAEFALVTRTCGGKPPVTVSEVRNVRTSELYSQDKELRDVQLLLTRAGLSDAAESNSMRWQDALIRGVGSQYDKGRAVFPISSTRRALPVDPFSQLNRKVYDAGTLRVGCGEPGYTIAGLRVYVDGLRRPGGWFFPNDADAPMSTISLNLAFQKPTFSFALPSTLRVRADIRCSFHFSQAPE